MNPWHRAFLSAILALAAGSAWGAARSPHEIFQALNALQVDRAQIYTVNDLHLRRGSVNLIFSDGVLGLLQSYDGRVTGIVFSGRGHVNANPRDSAEKRSLAHFLGVPLLDQNFSRAYMRFDDDSAGEILGQLRRSSAHPISADDFAANWDKSIVNLNPDQSTRLLMDWEAETPVPFFYAELLDDRLGAFDVLVDGRKSDPVVIGQERWAKGMRFYDVWASFTPASEVASLPQAFAPVSYAIDTTIEADRTLSGTTTIRIQAKRDGERSIMLELSRFLAVQSVQDGDGHALDFFQNESLNRNQVAARGNDMIVVLLPVSPHTGQTYTLRVAYRGNVISDAGKGLYFVGDRGIWYPHFSGMGNFTTFDTTFHWPRKLRLVATGRKIDEHEEGDRRIGHWQSDGPTAISGFNLGEYTIENMDAVDGVKIELTADSALENAIAERVRSQTPITTEPGAAVRPPGRPGRSPTYTEDQLESPGAPLRDLGHEIDQAIRFGEKWMGPFPYHELVVSQVPGTVGQGFPGLLYLPSLSFMPVATQQRAGMTGTSKEAVNEIIPFHEVAHQWWGNVVGWDNYRDQWLTEALANYIALAGADAERPNAHLLTHWLERYRKDLTLTVPDQENIVDDAGPLVHGGRLSSSHDPDAFVKIIYGKGAWVFHMLRMMMQDPTSKNPDDRFIKLLHSLMESHRYRALTTEDLQKAIERVMTPAMAVEGGHSMDWFFDQYVRSTGIPSYDLEYSVRPGPKGFLVRGKLSQKNVPDDFVLRVPIYGQGQGSKSMLLGHVITSGEETSFEFNSPVSPKHLLIDPQMTLLCIPSSSSSSTPQ
jgi:peptidase M1-like protein